MAGPTQVNACTLQAAGMMGEWGGWPLTHLAECCLLFPGQCQGDAQTCLPTLGLPTPESPLCGQCGCSLLPPGKGMHGFGELGHASPCRIQLKAVPREKQRQLEYSLLGVGRF